MFDSGTLFVEYAGWFIFFCIIFGALSIGVFVTGLVEHADHRTKGILAVGSILVTTAIVMLFLSIVAYYKDSDYDRIEKFEARGCKEVSIQAVDSFMNGTPVIIDDLYDQNVTVCNF